MWNTKLFNKVISNVKCKTIILLVDNTGENLNDLRYHDDFLYITPKAWSVKLISWTSSKLKATALQKKMLRELEDKPQTGRKHFLYQTHLIKDCYPKDIKNLKPNNKEMNKLIYFNTVHPNKYANSKRAWKYAPYHRSSHKFKLK